MLSYDLKHVYSQLVSTHVGYTMCNCSFQICVSRVYEYFNKVSNIFMCV